MIVSAYAKIPAIGDPYRAPAAGAKEIAVILPQADTENLVVLGERQQIEPKHESIARVPNDNTKHFRHMFD
jgi:hypothetical protein